MIQRFRDWLVLHFRTGSLRRRLAYSLAVVRLILVPVIFLAVYYLFVMGRIVDRIVNVDAPSATLAQQASIEMLEARRAERTYFLLHDAASLQTVDESTKNVETTLNRIQKLQPKEKKEVQTALAAAQLYKQQFQSVITGLDGAPAGSASQVQAVVEDYEKSLDELIRRERYAARSKLLDALRAHAASFDDQIMTTIQTRDPALQKVTESLQKASGEVLDALSYMENENWESVQRDHEQARQLLRRAEWTLSIVSGLTFILSIWISFILPRQLVQPLVNLKQVVDHAISGDYKENMDLQADGELGQLAQSIRTLIARVRAVHRSR
ncbi:MAG: hypothetical protein ACRD4Y_15585 [Candidatus Acidiferrales bacterium]